MLKTHHKILLVTTLVIIFAMFNWYSPTASSSSVNHSVIKITALIESPAIIVPSALIEAPTEIEPKTSLKIQQFPIFSGNNVEINAHQEFHNERFYSKLHAFKVKSKQLTSRITKKVKLQVKQKIKEKIIRISNIPVNNGFLSSQYGIRNDPFHGSKRMHNGIDIAAEYGSPVKPLGEGKVVYSGYKAGFGNTVEIKHGNTVLTRYAHLKQYLVEVGQQVDIHDSIGLIGKTGRSTGPHLHLEVLFNGKQADPQVFLANHYGSRPGSFQIVKAKIEAKSKVTKKIKKRANKESIKGKYFPQISYQDYVKSVNGMFGFSAPDSLSQ